MPDFGGFGRPTYYANIRGPESRPQVHWVEEGNFIQSAVAPGRELNVINRSNGLYYMDVGYWGETSAEARRRGECAQTFGVIYGDGSPTYGYAAVCSYCPGASAAELQQRVQATDRLGRTRPAANTFAEFIGHCRGRVLRDEARGNWLVSGWIGGLETDGRIYLVLGDLHLPVLTPQTQPIVRPGLPRTVIPDAAITDETYVDASREAHAVYRRYGLLEALGRLAHFRIDDWPQLYVASDIFGSAGADLCEFMNRVEGWSRRHTGTPVHLIQTGDMYEFWIGLECLFNDDPDGRIACHPPYRIARSRAGSTGARPVPGPDDQETREAAARIVRHWIQRVNESNVTDRDRTRNGTTVRAGEALARRLAEADLDRKTWLYGNHDNYLRWLTSRETGIARREDIDPPGQRLESWFDNHGVLFEHGHRADEYNRDGVRRGWEITQLAFVDRRVRELEGLGPNRRPQYMAHSVRHHLSSYLRAQQRSDPGRLVRLFVMAHTHAPFFTHILVGQPPLPARDRHTMAG